MVVRQSEPPIEEYPRALWDHLLPTMRLGTASEGADFKAVSVKGADRWSAIFLGWPGLVPWLRHLHDRYGMIGRSGLPAYIMGRVLWDPIASSGLRSLVEAAAVLLAYPRASCQHIFGLSRSIGSSKESQAFVLQGNNGEQRYLSWQCSSPTPGQLLLVSMGQG